MTNTPPKPKRRRWRWLVLGMVSALGLAVFLRWYPAQRPYDRAAWANADVHSLEDSTRLEMADWIISHRMLEGKREDDVIDLLGNPSPDYVPVGWDMAFLLGPERGWIRIDSEWLVVRFDKDGRVSATELIRD